MHGIAEPLGILVRMLAALFLVAATYNPSGYSYWHWAIRPDSTDWALKIFAGFLLIFGYVFAIQVGWRSMGLMMSLPLILVIASCLWLLSDWGWIDLSDWLERTLALEASIAIVLGTGVSFSLIRYRLSGQLNSRTIT
jgi:hypothetical protein